MSLEKSSQTEINELLSDIQLVNRITNQEINQISELLEQKTGTSDLDNVTGHILTKEISDQLGQLRARVSLCETSLKSLQISIGGTAGADITPPPERTLEQLTALSIPAAKLRTKPDLLPIEYDKSGTDFRWSGSNPEIAFELELDRSARLELQIRLFALVKPEYSKTLQVMIDGTHIKHRFYKDGSIYVVSCPMPIRPEKTETLVTVSLPASHTPKELGTSQDDRKLGIAINEIRVGRPIGWLTRVLKRLKSS